MSTPRFVDVYVPGPVDGDHAWGIAPRSAIVGTAQVGGTTVVDYEGNRYGSCPTFHSRLVIAAGRHATRYPTRARLCVASSDVIKVGTFDRETGELTLTDLKRLADWLGSEFATVHQPAD